MKTKALATLALVIVTAAVLATLDRQPSSPGTSEAPHVTRKERPKKPRTASPAVEVLEERSASSMNGAIQDESELEENLDRWSLRFEQLTAAGGNREEAVEVLRGEIDAVFSQWVADGIAPLAALPAAERYDALEILSQSVREGAAAVMDRLGLPGARHESLIRGAMEKVRAEVEYAEAAPDHASRLAMLRLDRERQQRLVELDAIGDEAERTRRLAGIDEWYETGLASVFPDEASDAAGE